MIIDVQPRQLFNPMLEIANKGGFDNPLASRFDGSLMESEAALGRGIINSDKKEAKDLNQGERQLSLQQIIPPNGYHAVTLVSRGRAQLEKSLATARPWATKLQLAKRPRFTLSSELEKEIESQFRQYIRPRQSLLESESIALDQLKRVAGLRPGKLMQLPMTDSFMDRAFNMLDAQKTQLQLLAGGKAEKPHGMGWGAIHHNIDYDQRPSQRGRNGYGGDNNPGDDDGGPPGPRDVVYDDEEDYGDEEQGGDYAPDDNVMGGLGGPDQYNAMDDFNQMFGVNEEEKNEDVQQSMDDDPNQDEGGYGVPSIWKTYIIGATLAGGVAGGAYNQMPDYQGTGMAGYQGNFDGGYLADGGVPDHSHFNLPGQNATAYDNQPFDQEQYDYGDVQYEDQQQQQEEEAPQQEEQEEQEKQWYERQDDEEVKEEEPDQIDLDQDQQQESLQPPITRHVVGYNNDPQRDEVTQAVLHQLENGLPVEDVLDIEKSDPGWVQSIINAGKNMLAKAKEGVSDINRQGQQDFLAVEQTAEDDPRRAQKEAAFNAHIMQQINDNQMTVSEANEAEREQRMQAPEASKVYEKREQAAKKLVKQGDIYDAVKALVGKQYHHIVEEWRKTYPDIEEWQPSDLTTQYPFRMRVYNGMIGEIRNMMENQGVKVPDAMKLNAKGILEGMNMGEGWVQWARRHVQDATPEGMIDNMWTILGLRAGRKMWNFTSFENLGSTFFGEQSESSREFLSKLPHPVIATLAFLAIKRPAAALLNMTEQQAQRVGWILSGVKDSVRHTQAATTRVAGKIADMLVLLGKAANKVPDWFIVEQVEKQIKEETRLWRASTPQSAERALNQLLLKGYYPDHAMMDFIDPSASAGFKTQIDTMKAAAEKVGYKLRNPELPKGGNRGFYSLDYDLAKSKSEASILNKAERARQAAESQTKAKNAPDNAARKRFGFKGF